MNDGDAALMLSTLKSIDATLKELLVLSKSKRSTSSTDKVSVDSWIATDADLDSQWGDEQVKFKPRDYTGDFTKGQKMSECAPELLDLLAKSFDYFADKNAGQMTDSGQPKSFYDKRSARRARGWAARLRAGWKPKATQMVSESEVNW